MFGWFRCGTIKRIGLYTAYALWNYEPLWFNWGINCNNIATAFGQKGCLFRLISSSVGSTSKNYSRMWMLAQKVIEKNDASPRERNAIEMRGTGWSAEARVVIVLLFRWFWGKDKNLLVENNAKSGSVLERSRSWNKGVEFGNARFATDIVMWSVVDHNHWDNWLIRIDHCLIQLSKYNTQFWIFKRIVDSPHDCAEIRETPALFSIIQRSGQQRHPRVRGRGKGPCHARETEIQLWKPILAWGLWMRNKI